jgi:predicted ABC-type sugar transport system permease subunit
MSKRRLSLPGLRYGWQRFPSARERLLAGWMCLVAELFILAQFKQGKDRAWLLPPLFVLWANLHGSWLIGMVLLALFCASGLVQGTWGRLQATRWTPASNAQAGADRKLERRGTVS